VVGVAAALVTMALLVGGSVGASALAATAEDDAEAVRDTHALVAATVGPESVLARLVDERSAALVTTLEVQDAVELPVEDYEAARSSTDLAVESLEQALEGADAPGLDALAGLEDVRSQVRAPVVGDLLANIDAAIDAFDAYTAVIDPFVASADGLLPAGLEAEVRRGAELSLAATRHADRSARLVREFLVAVLSGDQAINEEAEIQAVGNAFSERQSEGEVIATLAVGAYEPFAEAFGSSEQRAGLDDQFEAALATFGAAPDEVLGAWTGDDRADIAEVQLRREAFGVVAERLDADEVDALDRRDLYAALRTGALIVLGVCTFGVVAGVWRYRRTRRRA
jgi:hypothetical protein